MTDNRQRLNPHRTCQCGKRGWPTEHDAKQVVVNAKILRYLKGNSKRREQRAYQCHIAPGLWHVTSLAVFSPPPVRAAPEDVYREHVEDLLLADGDPDTETVWKRLLVPELVYRTNALLSEIHQDGLRHGANLKTHLADTNRRLKAGEVSPNFAMDEDRQYTEWVRHWARFQAIIVKRKDQARGAVKAANIAVANDRVQRENRMHREAVRRLAVAIHAHRETTRVATPADEGLWRVLGEVTVSWDDEPTPVVDLIESGHWAGEKS